MFCFTDIDLIKGGLKITVPLMSLKLNNYGVAVFVDDRLTTIQEGSSFM